MTGSGFYSKYKDGDDWGDGLYVLLVYRFTQFTWFNEFIWWNYSIPSSNLTHSYWKWQFIMGFTIKTEMNFHSYGRLPEGIVFGWD